MNKTLCVITAALCLAGSTYAQKINTKTEADTISARKLVSFYTELCRDLKRPVNSNADTLLNDLIDEPVLRYDVMKRQIFFSFPYDPAEPKDTLLIQYVGGKIETYLKKLDGTKILVAHPGELEQYTQEKFNWRLLDSPKPKPKKSKKK